VTSVSGSVVTVSADGLVRAVGDGTDYIEVSNGGHNVWIPVGVISTVIQGNCHVEKS
jgi:hypothetical protein